MGGETSRPTDKRREPEVICLGYQRTGTLSMALALERLGYEPVAHGGSQMLGREDAYMRKIWEIFQTLEDKERTLKALREVTIGFGALTDAPYNLFAEELYELYPDAKFIYLTRDVSAWWRSIEPVAKAARTWWLRYYNIIAPGWRWFIYIGDGFVIRNQQLGLDSWKLKTLEQHQAYVQSHVPPEKLLIMDIKEGWKPLCI
ncbi:uncharacterized protein FIESC28_01145 [Fusarium coffeatum]|uniref:Sulfotransferase domain-containing protein n=1 Tax=Fusarium coffeatum TaxID=231269 RepID=A0A366S9X1_9HYPO|nr:uncharacterized protein FIESC28_01145 [Fusarium coffeatum]RBR26117.1 hypothetical protein FIESC28_01145 [Fusarium coffeatum]